jgi:hypothetical protein
VPRKVISFRPSASTFPAIRANVRAPLDAFATTRKIRGEVEGVGSLRLVSRGEGGGVRSKGKEPNKGTAGSDRMAGLLAKEESPTCSTVHYGHAILKDILAVSDKILQIRVTPWLSLCARDPVHVHVQRTHAHADTQSGGCICRYRARTN